MLNGKKHGKGIEYAKNGNLKYNGEYLNGKRNGKGKLYNKKYYFNKIVYEGEFLNGKKSGRGIEFDDYNNFKYEGEYTNGKKMEGGKNIFAKIVKMNAN